MLRPRCALFFLALPAITGGCAAPTARVPVMRPAPVNLSAFDLVAVDGFPAPSGCDSFSDEIAAGLRSTPNPVTRQVEYEVITRSEVSAEIDGLRAGRGRQHDAMDALERWRSADVLIRGQVLAHDVDEDVTRVERKDAKGNSWTEQVRKVTARVSVAIETMQPSSAGDRTFDSIQLTETARASTRARDRAPDPVDHHRLLSTARQSVVTRFLQRVLPRQEYVHVQLRTAGELPDLEIGNGFAQVGDWEAATDSYERAAEQPGATPASRAAALYDLGLAYGFMNRFDEAREALRESFTLDRSRRTLTQLQGLDQRESEYRVLLDQTATAAQPAR